MRIEDEITIARPPEEVFDFVTDPSRLPEWQLTTAAVRREREGPLQMGERFTEVHKALGRELESKVEVAAYDRPRAFALNILEGAVPLNGHWTFEEAGEGTLVHFTGEGTMPGLMKLSRPMLRHQFRTYHRRLRTLLEAP